MRVVNSYEAASDSVEVNFVKIVDFPTEGNLIIKNKRARKEMPLMIKNKECIDMRKPNKASLKL